jgi:hypothetical protein
MQPTKRPDDGQQDLLRSRLDQIVDLDHPLPKLARPKRYGGDGAGIELTTGAVADRAATRLGW